MGDTKYQDVIFKPLDSVYLHSHTTTKMFTLVTPKAIYPEDLNQCLNPHDILAHVFWSPRWTGGKNEVFIITLRDKRVFGDIRNIIFDAVMECIDLEC